MRSSIGLALLFHVFTTDFFRLILKKLLQVIVGKLELCLLGLTTCLKSQVTERGGSPICWFTT